MEGDLKEYGNVKGVRGCRGGAGIASPLQACDQAVQMFGGENAGAEAAGAEAAGGEAASGYPMIAGFSGGMQ